MVNHKMMVLVLLSACACVLGCADQARTAGNEGRISEMPVDNTTPPPLPGGLRLDTGELFPDGDLFMVRTQEVYPFTIGSFFDILAASTDTHFDDQAFYCCPYDPEFSLVYVSGGKKSLIRDIEDLRWKVSIKTKADAGHFADLIGGKGTSSLFRDARGCEVALQGESECPLLYKIDARSFVTRDLHEVGLRQIETCEEATEYPLEGFFVLRFIYIPRTSEELPPARLVATREFVSSDGIYVFGTDKVIAEGKECPPIVFPNHHWADNLFRSLREPTQGQSEP